MDERSLSIKVFNIIEISSEKWWKQNPGTEYSHGTEFQSLVMGKLNKINEKLAEFNNKLLNNILCNNLYNK